MEKGSPVGSYRTAGLFSRMFFCWPLPLLRIGWKKGIEEKDSDRVLPEDRSEYLGNLLQEKWKKELEKKKPSLLKTLIPIFGRKYLLLFTLPILQECFLLIVQAYLLGIVIDYFDDQTADTETIARLSAAGVCMCLFLYMLCIHSLIFNTQRLDMQLRAACCSLIYRKALRLSHSSISKSTIGRMVNLLSNDVDRFDKFIYLSYYVIISPLQAIIIVAMLWQYIGPAVLAGVAVLFLYIPVQFGLGRLFSKLRLKAAKLADKRFLLLNEILTGLRVIKMYAWEDPLIDSIEKIRKLEIQSIKQSLQLYGIPFSLGSIFSKLILFLALAVYSLTGGKLTASSVFITVTISMNFYRCMFYAFPQAVSQIAEALVSLQRLQNFLLLEEKSTDVSEEMSSVDKCGVWVDDVSASWHKDSKTGNLQNISFSANSGNLIAVIGSVGSGKTTLLMSIIGELPITSGKVTLQGTVAYASQEPWIFGGTIRENILFGSDFQEKKYNKVLHLSALDKDINDFPDNDSTLVGERGTNLSGGQKARINLARALYLNADIIVLDDPLSSVDPPVAEHIFHKCIMQYLKNKIRIIATHQAQFLKQADKIILLEKGKCVAVGTYKDLVAAGIDIESLPEEREFKNKGRINSTPSSPVIDTRPSINDNSHRAKSSRNISFPRNQKEDHVIETKKCGNREKTGPGQTGKNVLWTGAKLYAKYVAGGKDRVSGVVFLFFLLVSQMLFSAGDYWLILWTNGRCFVKNYTFSNYSDVNRGVDDIDHRYSNTLIGLYVYLGLIFGLITFSLISAALYVELCTKSSNNLHRRMLRCVVRTPVSFLDNNSIGEVLNRFSRDVGSIDQQLPMTSFSTIHKLVNIIGSLVIEAIIHPYLLFPSIILLIATFFLWNFYLRTARNVMRMDGSSKSPVFAHLSTSLYGISTIRTCKVEKKFEFAFDRYQDRHTAVRFLFIGLSRWMAINEHALCILYLVATMFILFFVSSAITGAELGLAVSSALLIFVNFYMMIDFGTEMDSQLSSVERVADYSSLPSEAADESPDITRPPENWPLNGSIIFDNVSLKYSSEKQPVVKNLNFRIKNGEKIGIVGRTGAGKSSIIAALFRMLEPTGIITIDGIATKDIGLYNLRRKLSIIPQDPLLFTASVRNNLDPFNRRDDATLWKVLEEVHLKEVVGKLGNGLDSQLSEGGGNLSVGQKQLLCVARAILRQNKILIMDEATANIDKRTDCLIQKTIGEKFSSCTIITVAHRLQTIMDSDRIMVLDEGKIVEFDNPDQLLKNKNGLFYRMVQTGGNSAEKNEKTINA
ncbi:multidrug resistance-associated protein 4-like [Centruroides sculpturatus]|uniref:multidrug resistance-associated protein 4-like n=1 Tax=Centruroides sculpturatus TaxID=218467 RepID=UPI000C6DEA99|nr:multidrug resistance-associated protein 4-like [Centruroides sculpturatus]